MTMSERLWHLLSGKLDEIAALYKVRPRITLIVRVPGKPKECAFLSDDSWAEAVATVRDLHGDPTAFAAGPPEPVAAAPFAPPPASVEVRESVLGTCELCRASRRRVHRELPNRFVECHGAGFVWLCKRCGRWNTAINNGKAICCTDPCERGGE